VIARQFELRLQGQAVKREAGGREWVRKVLEGSVRQAAGKVRIKAID